MYVNLKVTYYSSYPTFDLIIRDTSLNYVEKYNLFLPL